MKPALLRNLASSSAAMLAVPALGFGIHGVSAFGQSFPRYVRTVGKTRALAPGQAALLAGVRGFHYPLLGQFLARCSSDGTASTRYQLSTVAVTTWVAIRGRGVSQHAVLNLPRRFLAGGRKRFGVERWTVTTGGEPEDLRVNATIAVASALVGGSCHFRLHGTIVITEH